MSQALPVRLVALCVGVVICCLGLSMYQMPDEELHLMIAFPDHDREMAEDSLFLAQNVQ